MQKTNVFVNFCLIIKLYQMGRWETVAEPTQRTFPIAKYIISVSLPKSDEIPRWILSAEGMNIINQWRKMSASCLDIEPSVCLMMMMMMIWWWWWWWFNASLQQQKSMAKTILLPIRAASFITTRGVLELETNIEKHLFPPKLFWKFSVSPLKELKTWCSPSHSNLGPK